MSHRRRGLFPLFFAFWRDLGYAIGAVITGITADLLGLSGALWIVAALTFISGLIVATRLQETLATAGVRRSDSLPLPTSGGTPRDGR
jgi:predicted MFS family arabinose efflux permease